MLSVGSGSGMTLSWMQCMSEAAPLATSKASRHTPVKPTSPAHGVHSMSASRDPTTLKVIVSGTLPSENPICPSPASEPRRAHGGGGGWLRRGQGPGHTSPTRMRCAAVRSGGGDTDAMRCAAQTRRCAAAPCRVRPQHQTRRRASQQRNAPMTPERKGDGIISSERGPQSAAYKTHGAGGGAPGRWRRGRDR